MSKETYAESFTHILDFEEEYKWYCEIKSRMMVRFPKGTKIYIYSYQQDDRGRIIAAVETGDYIFVEESEIIKIEFH